jgi:pimeloyl-ACP methyl ester carboxylesterase
MKYKAPFTRGLFVVITCMAMTSLCAQSRPKAKSTGAEAKQGTLVTETLTSSILRDTKIGVDPNRSIHVYLPPGYATSGKSYPVVYYCHSTYSNPTNVLREGNVASLLDQAIERNVIKPIIFVVADYSTALTGSFYENSVVSGRWLDFTAQELVPFVDHTFRTLRSADSRALAGHFMGGRGALKLAMDHAELFSVVYAMHPVATGTGYQSWSNFPTDWWKILNAKSPEELKGDFILGMSRAFLPNVDRPPFYCDFFMELENGNLKLDPEKTAKTQATFLLDRMLPESAAHLRSMHGIAFDWARYDSNQDHVLAARAFSIKLDDLGIEHEAEEYRGDPFHTVWGEDGRFYTRALPFFARHLVFEMQN